MRPVFTSFRWASWGRPIFTSTMRHEKAIRSFVAGSGKRYEAGPDGSFQVHPIDMADAKRLGFTAVITPRIIGGAK